MGNLLSNLCNFLLNAILYIFAILGGIQIFRGLLALANKTDNEEASDKKSIFLFFGTIIAVGALFFVCHDIAYNKGEAYGKENASQEVIYYSGDLDEQNDQSYDLGFEDGIKSGEESAIYNLLNQYEGLVYDLRTKYDIDLESAIGVLYENQDGVPVSQEELQSAIDALSEFYYGMDELYRNTGG